MSVVKRDLVDERIIRDPKICGGLPPSALAAVTRNPQGLKALAIIGGTALRHA